MKERAINFGSIDAARLSDGASRWGESAVLVLFKYADDCHWAIIGRKRPEPIPHDSMINGPYMRRGAAMVRIAP